MKAFSFAIALTVSLMAVTQAEEGLPPDVQKLVDQRTSAIEKIDKAFVLELDKLKTKYMKLGNLDAANTINLLAKKHGSDQSVDPKVSAVKPLIGQWSSRQEDTSKKEMVTITETHFIEASGKRHLFSVEGNSIRVHWNGSSQVWVLITLQPGDGNSMKGVNHEGTHFSYSKVKK